MSQLEVDKVIPQSGTTLTIGDSGDTITIASGATLVTGGDISTGNNGSLFILDNVGQKSGQITNDGSSSNSLQIDADPDNSGADTYMQFKIDDSEKMRITSTDSVGIGTSTPTTIASDTTTGSGDVILNVKSSGDARIVAEGTQGGSLVLVDSNATSNQRVVRLESTGGKFQIQGDTDASIGSGSAASGNIIVADLSNGNVGINTASPSRTLDVGGIVRSSTAFALGGNTSTPSEGSAIYRPASDNIAFVTNNNERLRIDSSGNFMVGKTASNYTSPGVEAKSNGNLIAVRDSGNVVNFIRNSNDGSIVTFAKDTTNFASIGVNGDNLVIDGLATDHSGLDFANDKIFARKNSSASDNGVDLGYSGGRFKDIYLGGGAFIGGTGTANKLDDYEEGTWTPAFPNISPTYSTQTGTYTKIGNTVFCTAYISTSSFPNSSSSPVQLNLPFVGASNPQFALFDMAIPYNVNALIPSSATAMENAGVRIEVATMYFKPWYSSGAGGSPLYNTFNSSGDIVFTFQYQTN